MISVAANNSKKKLASIAVVLGFYQGKDFISEQVQSICNQVDVNVTIYIFDDCSFIPLKYSDLGTLDKLHSQVSMVRRCKNTGFQMNFLKGLAEINDSYDYYAFSDQDDVWYEKKLSSAVKQLDTIPSRVPAAIGGRTEIWDAHMKKQISSSPHFKKEPCFANSLVQSIVSGNTIVLNQAAKK